MSWATILILVIALTVGVAWKVCPGCSHRDRKIHELEVKVSEQERWLERHGHYDTCLKCWRKFTEQNPDHGGQMCQSCWANSHC